MDDYDPLDEILLSDEELPKPFNSIQRIQSVTQKVNKSEFDDEKEKEKKKKIIAELFGSPDDFKSETNIVPVTPKINKSDWLMPKTDTDKLPTVSGESNKTTESAAVQEPLEYSTSKERTTQFADSPNVVSRRQSETKTSKIVKTKQRFKSFDLNLHEFKLYPESPGDNQSQDNEKDKSVPSGEFHLPSKNHSAVKANKIGDTLSPGCSQSSYTPSEGCRRRFAVKPKSAQCQNTNWLSVFSPENEQKLPPEDVKESLPDWLKLKRNSISLDYPKTETNSNERITDVEQSKFSSPDEAQPDENHDKVESEFIGDFNKVVSDLGHNVTGTVVKLKEEQDALKQIAKFQTEKFTKREREIHETAIQLILHQRENINALLQIISSNNPVSSHFSNREEITSRIKNFEETIFQLQIKLTQYQLEITELQLKAEHKEKNYKLDLSMVEDIYKRKLQMVEDIESFYKKEMRTMEREYNVKLAKRKEEEEELVSEYNEKIKLLKEAHVEEMQYATKLQNLKYPWKLFSRDKDVLNNSESSPDKNLILKELEIEDSQKELLVFEERLNKQKIVLDSKEIALNIRIEEYDLKMAKEKLHVEQQKKDLKLAQSIFEEKQICWLRELQREKDYLSNSKEELELIKEELLKEERKLTKEKFEVNAERARLEAIMSAEGSSGQSKDFIRSRAELQGTIDELRSLKSKLECERNEVKLEDTRLKEESWRLRDVEQQLRLQQMNLEKLLQNSEEKREEGVQALKKAQKIESQIDDRLQEVETLELDLKRKEDMLTQEKIELSRERDLLTKRRYQLDMILPQLTYEEQLPFTLWNKTALDPRMMMLKLNSYNVNNH